MLATIISLVLMGGLGLTPTHAPMMPACTAEDSTAGPVPCFWDATKHGNETGHSFIRFSKHDNSRIEFTS